MIDGNSGNRPCARESRRFAVLLWAGLAVMLTSMPAGAQMIAIKGDPVRTSTGLVAGTMLPSGIHGYLGIPYAKQPVDDLRWKPPQPVSWNGVWNADRKAPECIQPLRRHDINHYFGEEASGENCLYMNIWAPAEVKPGAKLPVVVFIYGGGGTIGSGAMAHYDGENVAKNGAIFVNFNYRVGILGFMAHPELTKEQGGHSGNYGYLDQNAALKWIHDNIAAFGGDPSKIVVGGQSFGAGSVAAQIMSPLSKGLFSSAFLSSGCNFTRELPSQEDGEKIGLEIQKQLGVANLAELRNVAADKILALQSETEIMANRSGITVSGVLDGHFWTGTFAQTLAAHTGSAVPIIANSNGDDNDGVRNPLTQAHTVAEYQSIARQMYGANADDFLRLYPVNSDAEVSAAAHRAAIESGYMEAERTCGELEAKFSGQPTYVDLFVRRHTYAAGAKIADQDTATVGAYHNADIPFWFGTLESFNAVRKTRDWTAQDRTMSDRMMHALIALASTGKPETSEVNWPAWTAASPQYLRIGDKIEVQTMDIQRMDWLAAHPPVPVKVAPPTGLRSHD